MVPIIVDINSRQIRIPHELRVAGTVGDSTPTSKYFVYYIGNTNLSNPHIAINWQNAGGQSSQDDLSDVKVIDKALHFTWNINPACLNYPGELQFSIELRDGADFAISTKKATLAVYEGIEVGGEIDSNPSLYDQLMSRINAMQDQIDQGGGGGGTGTAGADGFSPIAKVTSNSNGGAIITITDKNGTTTAEVKRGEKGETGATGATGAAGRDGAEGAKGDPFTFADFTSEQLNTLKTDIKNSIQADLENEILGGAS